MQIAEKRKILQCGCPICQG